MIKLHHFAYQAITVFGQAFQLVLLTMQFLTLRKLVLASPALCSQPTENVGRPTKGYFYVTTL